MAGQLAPPTPTPPSPTLSAQAVHTIGGLGVAALGVVLIVAGDVGLGSMAVTAGVGYTIGANVSAGT